jgi:predicted permease
MNGLLQDLRYALRQLRKSPGFTCIAIVTLALGVGANAVVFSGISSLLLHRLPIAKPDRVFFLEAPGGHGGANASYPVYEDLRDRNTTFLGLIACRLNVVGLQVGGAIGRAARVWLYEASGNYFSTLGVKPYLGRFFTPEEDKVPDANPVAVLSYASWNARFHADPNIVGQTVAINGHFFTVIGVAPHAFQGTELWFAPEMWVPISMVKTVEGWSWLDNRFSRNTWILGRLKDGITPQQATANLNAIAQQLAREYPKSDTNLAFELARPGLLGNIMGRPMRAFLLGLSLLAGLVLLAACTNLGSLLLARVTDRYRELGIRIAIGARRVTILRQLLTEALVLALAGGLIGVGVNLFLLQFIGQIQLPMDIPIQLVLSSDQWVVLLALAISLATALIFVIAPAQQIWRTDPNMAITSTQPLITVTRRWAFRDILLGLQVAICCVLVTACFTSLRGLGRALHTSFGFDPRNVVLAGFDPTLAGRSSEQAAQLQRSIAEQAARLPGVISVGYANSVPLSLDSNTTTVFNEKVSDLNFANGIHASQYSISPEYLKSAGTRLLAGRDIRWDDDAKAPSIAIVNLTFAKKVVGTPDAIGKHFRSGSTPNLTEIIGVVEDGKYEALTEDPQPAVFFPISQVPNTTTVLVIRAAEFDPNLATEIRMLIRQQDPAIPVYSLGAWEEMLGLALFPARAATIALSAFGTLGLLLAATGIYGLAAYSVTRRMRELGIRMALGSQQRKLLQAVLGRAFVLLASGSVVGLLLGVAAGKVLAHIVYQASAGDPVVLISVAVTMMLVGLLSTAIPARRAAGVDPMVALRYE